MNFGLNDLTAKGAAVPTYEYLCTDCGSPLEIVQSIHEPSLTHCPDCGGKLRKVFGNVGVVFKGSGFYKTDSRSADAKKKAAATTDSKNSGDSKTTGDSGPKKADGASTPGTGEAVSSTKAADSGSSSDGGSKQAPAKPAAAPTSS